MKPNTLSSVLFALLAYFTLSPRMEAVVPPPDGGYPGGNTAEGQNALLSLTNGQNNTAVGLNSLSSTTTSSSNTAIGSAALRFNTGHDNTASGAGALRNNTSGSNNVADGADALRNNVTGAANTAIGAAALSSNNRGNSNTAVGTTALFSNTTGNYNTATGESALVFNTIGQSNTATGYFALRFNTGHNNTAIGSGAGSNHEAGSNNIYIGANTGGVDDENNACYIASIFGQTSSSGVPVLINLNNKLGTMTSSKRFKENIKPMDTASDVLYAMKSVTFRYKNDIDPASMSQFGLVAEDVQEVNPDLVVRDREGKPYTVRDEAVNAMLLNEFLKEHRKVEKQQATITQLKKELQTTAARQQEQIEGLRLGLQKVSARLELSKAVPQTVLNNQ